jgi:hypothetical protein
MALESATYIDGLVITNPTGSDSISQGDDHIRLIKTVLKNSLPNVTGAADSILGMGVGVKTSSTDIRSTSMTDTGLTASYTKVSAASDIYVDVTATTQNWSSFDNEEVQTGFYRLVYATSTATGISPSGDLSASRVERDWTSTTSTANFAFGWSAIFKVTGLSAAAYTFKLQAKCGDAGDGGITTDFGTMRVWEIIS